MDDIFSFLTEEVENPPQLRLYDRLRIASLVTKLELSNKTLPAPTIEIMGETNTSIVVREREEDGRRYLVIYRNADSDQSPMIKVANNRFQRLYFGNLRDCRVFIMTKLEYVMFKNCNSCQISLRQPVIGMREFYKCSDTNLNIKIPENTEVDYPITRIEECNNFHIYQSNDAIVYLVRLCLTVTGTIVDTHTNVRERSYDLGQLFWNENEQKLVCLSREEGFGVIPANYELNNMEQILFLDERKPTDAQLPFGTTPPIAKN